MTRTVLVGDLRTGLRIAHLPVSGASWTMAHRRAGDISATIPLGARDFAALERQLIDGAYPGADTWPSASTWPMSEVTAWVPGDGLRPEFLASLDPARRYMAILEDDVVIEAGPIWAHTYDSTANTLTVKASGMRSLFDHRVVMGVVADGVEAAAWTATYGALSLGTIAKRLIELAMAHTGGDLPIILPADEAGAHERAYFGYEVGKLGDRLDQLMGVIDGPDIALEPRLRSDRMGIEWVLRTGTVADPLLHQAGDDHVWDSRVPRGGLGGLDVSRDASAMAFRAWETGDGMDTAKVIEFGGTNEDGWPLLESVSAHGTVAERGVLQAWVSSDLQSSTRPWMSWSFSAQADMSPRLGSYRPGDWCRVWIPTDHPYLSMLVPAGFHRARVIQVSGDLGNTVKVTLAPTRELR